MKASLELKGFDALASALSIDLPKAVDASVMREVGMEAMAAIEERAKAYAPVDDGDYRDSITTQDQSGAQGVEIATGPTGRQEGGVGAYQEFGTVNMAANPHIRPAVDNEGPRVIQTVADELGLSVGKAADRIAKRTGS